MASHQLLRFRQGAPKHHRSERIGSQTDSFHRWKSTHSDTPTRWIIPTATTHGLPLLQSSTARWVQHVPPGPGRNPMPPAGIPGASLTSDLPSKPRVFLLQGARKLRAPRCGSHGAPSARTRRPHCSGTAPKPGTEALKSGTASRMVWAPDRPDREVGHSGASSNRRICQ